jgi:putative transcriptional regulator
MKATDLVLSGSPETVAIELAGKLSATNSIAAIKALSRRGVNLLKAKRAIEAALTGEKIVILVPHVERLKTLAQELSKSGFRAYCVRDDAVDVKQLRETLGLTQEQFAMRFGLELDAVRNWEYGRRQPDRAARSYLSVISKEPELVQRALAEPIA